MRWPEPLPVGIEVYRLDLDTTAEPLAARRLLTPCERARADRFAHTADRVRFTATRGALRRLLAERLRCAAAALPLAADARGRPFLEGIANAPHFNVSHSGAHALLALGDPRAVGAIGIDIEQCQRGVASDDALLDLAFSARESQALRNAADPLQAFHAHWTAKEAVLKAAGVGVTEHLRHVEVHRMAAGRLRIDCAIPGWTHLQATALAAPPGYAAALAWCAKEPT